VLPISLQGAAGASSAVVSRDADSEYIKLLPSSRRTEFRLFLALERTIDINDPLGLNRVGDGLPTEEDYIPLVPANRRAAFRKYLEAAIIGAGKETKLRPVLNLPDLVQKVRSAVVSIRAGDNSGTGFILNRRLYTCAHVVAGASDVEFENNYGVHGVASRIYRLDTERDLAVFLVGYSDRTLDFGDYAGIPTGSQIAVIGTPVGLEETVTSGIVSAKRQLGDLDLLQLSATVAPGSSGSPVFDMRGQVIGMVQSRLTDEHAYAFALGASELKQAKLGVALEDLAARHSASGVWAPEQVRQWDSKFRAWASSAVDALRGIDVEALTYSPDADTLANRQQLIRLKKSIPSAVSYAAGFARYADDLEMSPGSLYCWYEAGELMSRIREDLWGLFEDFGRPGWTGVVSDKEFSDLARISNAGIDLGGELSSKLASALMNAYPPRK
jgi:hypothetical protein